MINDHNINDIQDPLISLDWYGIVISQKKTDASWHPSASGEPEELLSLRPRPRGQFHSFPTQIKVR